LAVIYRPPSAGKGQFLKEFDAICSQMQGSRNMIMGDMNIDIQQDQRFVSIARKYGMAPVSTTQTVRSGKCLDVVFTTFSPTFHNTIKLYFSDHRACWCSLF